MTYSGPTDLYIAGTWRPAATGARFTVTDPATGTAIADVADADVTDARAEVLRRVFEAMTAHRDELAELIVRENGKPLTDARGEIAYAAEFFRWYSEEAVRAPGSLSLSPGGERRIMTSSRPVGVSLLITPWNLPAAMVTRKVAPALAAGCTVVVNLPSTPRSSRFAWPNCSHWPECRPAWSASCPRPATSPSSATCSNAGRCGCSRSPAPPGWAARCWPRPPRGSSTARWNWAGTRRSSSAGMPTWMRRCAVRWSPSSATARRSASRPTGSSCTKTAWRSSRGVSPSRVPGCASATAWTREPTSGR